MEQLTQQQCSIPQVDVDFASITSVSTALTREMRLFIAVESRDTEVAFLFCASRGLLACAFSLPALHLASASCLYT